MEDNTVVINKFYRIFNNETGRNGGLKADLTFLDNRVGMHIYDIQKLYRRLYRDNKIRVDRCESGYLINIQDAGMKDIKMFSDLNNIRGYVAGHISDTYVMEIIIVEGLNRKDNITLTAFYDASTKNIRYGNITVIDDRGSLVKSVPITQQEKSIHDNNKSKVDEFKSMVKIVDKLINKNNIQ